MNLSPEEIEIKQLQEKVGELERYARSLERTVAAKEQEVQYLRRRKPPHVMDKTATDKFRRPAYSR